jgi:hypothetical protein
MLNKISSRVHQKSFIKEIPICASNWKVNVLNKVDHSWLETSSISNKKTGNMLMKRSSPIARLNSAS